MRVSAVVSVIGLTILAGPARFVRGLVSARVC
jgi:hypothetical protein